MFIDSSREYVLCMYTKNVLIPASLLFPAIILFPAIMLFPAYNVVRNNQPNSTPNTKDIVYVRNLLRRCTILKTNFRRETIDTATFQLNSVCPRHRCRCPLWYRLFPTTSFKFLFFRVPPHCASARYNI